MPKTFSEQEKEIIKKNLLQKGREIFSTYGLKKTSVADLTKAVGIAQGSFYKFFDSKEELYFEILELEHSGSEKLLGDLLNTCQTTKEALRTLIQNTFALMESNPLMRNLYENNDYELLIRRLPPEKLAQHQANDANLALTFITRMQQKGELMGRSPEVIAGLFRAIIFLPFHKEEIGRNIYPEVIELLTKLISDGLAKEEN